MKVFIPLVNGFEEIEAITVVDVLRRGGIDVTIVSIESTQKVIGSHNIIVEADTLFDNTDFSSGDMIVLPGGMPGTNNLNAHKGLKNILIDYNNYGKWLYAICAAPLVLGELEILSGKLATSYPGFEERLIGAKTLTDNVVVSKNIVTSRGAGTAMEFAFMLVELANGKESAKNLRESMLYEMN
jgi:4-methyl-5(b-hydroxyethyl)-thiazole monophosphate biosynthesis